MNGLLARIGTVVFSAVSLAAAIFMIWGSQLIGIANDEHVHMLDLGDWKWASNPDLKHFGVYGLSFQLLGHVSAVLLGIEQFGVIGFEWASFAVRHVVSAMLAILTAICAALIVLLLTRKKLWALWSAAALLTVPVFFGHGMFNPKDVPVAFGYTLLTLGCVSMLTLVNKKVTPGFLQSAGAVTCIAVALWIAVGTRYGMVFPFFASILLLVTILLFYVWVYQSSLYRVLFVLSLLLMAVFAGSLFLLLTNPCIVAPVTSRCRLGTEILPVIFERSSQYQDRISTFIAGVVPDPKDPNFWSLPLSLFVGASLLIWLLAFGGLVFFPENWSIKGAEVASTTSRLRFTSVAAVILVACQVFLIPVFVVIMRGTWYDLQRQHLYVYPAIVVLAALGLALLWQKAGSAGRTGLAQRASVVALATTALLSSGIDIAKLWPYSYVYVNEISAVTGFGGVWELDYTFLSDREALSYVPANAPFRTVGAYWKLKPFLHERGLRAPKGMKLGRDLATSDYVVYSNRLSLGQTQLPAECDELAQVTRVFRGEKLVLSATGICPKNLAVGVSFEDLLKHDP